MADTHTHTQNQSNLRVLAVCPQPELGANIKMDGIQKYFNPGEELVLSCELGYTPTSGPRVIVCGRSGRWSGTNLVCERGFPLL